MEDNEIVFRRLSIDDERPEFDCGDTDLNDFFLNDSRKGCAQLVSVTYSVEKGDKIVAFFCVSNDAIRSEDTSKSRFKKIKSGLPREKRYHSMPSVKIGRLATALEMQGNGIGTQVLDLIKMWFTEGNKTGCRFIIVDAINKPNTISFYQKNGFEFLDVRPETRNDATQLMFFDLLTFRD